MIENLVSAVVPVYNNRNDAAACIQSLLAQTWPWIEIIIIDDGSSDDSLNVVGKYEAENVKIISQRNAGAAAARNAGLKVAQGGYIQFLDADDLLSPDKIEAQMYCLNGSQTQLAICPTIHFNDGETPVAETSAREWFYRDHEDPVDFLIKLYAGDEILPGYGGMIAVHSWLTPRSVIDKAGLWNEQLSVDDDGEFFCRVIMASGGIKFSENGISYYRKFYNRQTLSAQKSKVGTESAIKAIDCKYQYLQSKTAEPIVDKVFARHYWWAGVLAYPQFKSLSGYCISKARHLGYQGEKYVGGHTGHTLARLAGWRVARLISYYLQQWKTK